MHAAQKTRLPQAAAGQFGAVMGLTETRTGDTLSDRAHPVVLERLAPYASVVSQAIEPGAQGEREPLLEALARIADEDPTFTSGEDRDTGQLLISGMGELHLEVVAERLRREFGLSVRTGRPQVVLRETVSVAGEAEATFEREVDGAPVFGRVAVRVAPLARGAGLRVVVAPEVEGLPFVRAEVAEFLRAGAREAAEAGVLEGHPLQDLEVTITGATWREGASRPFAYKVAAASAVRAAATRAGPVILEPVAALSVVAPTEFLGDVIGGVDRRGGTILEVTERGAAVREVTAEAPLRRLFGYATDLRSATQGRATFTLRLARFDVAP
jgi:elongation factor G